MVSFLKNRFFFKQACKITLSLFVFVFLATTASASEKTINYRLKWLINASVAGDIYASAHGFFENQGLRVNVKPGGPERDAIRELELGYAQFGVASADQVIRAADKGAKVVVVAQLFQINPLQWIYRADEVQLRSLSDLKGKKVGVTFGGNDETIFKALLATGNIRENELSIFSVRYDYTPFFRRKVDIWPVYRNTQGIFISDKLAKAGEKSGFFNPSEFGVRFVANSVVTSQKMMKNDPDKVRRFVRALMAGWEAALAPENAEKCIATIAQHDKDSTAATIARQLESTRKMIKPTPGFAIGIIDKKAWMQTEQIMLDQNLIKAPVHIETWLNPM